MNKMIETIKEIHTKDICLFKIGTFYHAYGRDAFIFKLFSFVNYFKFLINLQNIDIHVTISYNCLYN